ncbi:MAG: DUF1905 domain-containing protein [Bdellovibrionota bacterium]
MPRSANPEKNRRLKSETSKLRFSAMLWRYQGAAGWYFVTLPRKLSLAIRSSHRERARNWGSLGCEATIGTTAWKTSLFPDRAIDAYLLPVKAAVRKRELLQEGERIQVQVRIL